MGGIPPAEIVSAWIPFLTIWIVWAAVCAVNAFMFLRRVRSRADAVAAGDAPPVVVVTAVKGVPEDYALHLESLLSQRYPRYRVAFCVESREDPAVSFLTGMLGLPELQQDRTRVTPSGCEGLRAAAGPGLESVEIVVAGLARDEGQKIHNVRSALANLEDESGDRVVAFVDGDALPGPDWLARLVAPLGDPRVGVSTGYRWLVPVGGDWPSSFASAINASVVTALGPHWRNSAWAGSMALRREIVDRLELGDLWRGALNDDTLLSASVLRSGLRVAFADGLLLPTPARYDWAGLFEFGRRQYLQVRVCRPELWAAAALLHPGYVLAWLLCLSLCWIAGGGVPLAFAGGVVLLDRVRAAGRERVARAVLESGVTRRLRRAWLLDRWGSLAVSAVHAALVCGALVSRRVAWAGIRYSMDGPRKTRVLARDGAGAQPR